ncbi:antitoxin MazE-like protein [Aureimonas endophytica]|uniref:antitoxin MazE-like protein n=1 Tax=Aureimonas endophytica TaxID=2027858 RepID=UPI00166598E9|nr:antitoxin MazE-like protein [Aureimonas endophytica]
MSDTERAELLAKGYRPVELWVPDLSDPDLRALAVEEGQRIARADEDEGVMDWLELVQKDMWEGEDQI